ncbi:MAG: GNAT family N-acetyltransferase [Deltaproteobacteria bacterium]|nr:GNAT family N-acetyltransferase [Deltaproteobacteria bacterium]
MSYEVVPLRLEEHGEALGRLWAENMSDPRIAEHVGARIEWLYRSNPGGPATTCLCLHRESGAVIGCGSFLPRATWAAGAVRRGAVLCDFAVARAHRVVGAALAIQRGLLAEARAAGIELLYGYPNQKSAALFGRLGYRQVAQATTWVKPLRSLYKLREILPWKAAAQAAALPADLGLRLLDGALRVLARRPAVATPLAPGDRRVDELWQRARRRYGVVGEQTGSYLDWRYGRFVTQAHQLVGVEGPDGQLAGYAACSLAGGAGLVRHLFSDRDPDTDEALLLALAGRLRDQGADSLLVCYVGDQAFGPRLRRVGFLPRPGSRPLMVHAESVPEALRAEVLDPDRWLMLDGEIDI